MLRRFSLLSSIHRANRASAMSSISCSVTARSSLRRFAAWFSRESSNSPTTPADESIKNSNGIFIDSFWDAQKIARKQLLSNRTTYLVVLTCLFIPCLHAGELPNVPIAKPVTHDHRFMDRWNKIEFVTMMTAESVDMGQTCNNLAHVGHEVFQPSQSCAGVVSLTMAYRGAALLAAYGLHRTHHHKLERIPMLFMISGSVQGMVYSKQHGAW